jgi:hypothetical protein
LPFSLSLSLALALSLVAVVCLLCFSVDLSLFRVVLLVARLQVSLGRWYVLERRLGADEGCLLLLSRSLPPSVTFADGNTKDTASHYRATSLPPTAFTCKCSLAGRSLLLSNPKQWFALCLPFICLPTGTDSIVCPAALLSLSLTNLPHIITIMIVSPKAFSRSLSLFVAVFDLSITRSFLALFNLYVYCSSNKPSSWFAFILIPIILFFRLSCHFDIITTSSSLRSCSAACLSPLFNQV